jgi:hypothetical protein
VVPPGKTLFIAAPLPIGPAGNPNPVFQGITIADKATYFAQVNPSIQAAINGGTTVDENTPEGKVVILNGGSITTLAASATDPITIGGYLEIHRGGFIDVNAATFSSTAGSTINNYGQIIGGTTRLVLNGELTVKGGGSVSGSNQADVFNGKITVESYGEFSVGAYGANIDFEGPVEVQANAKFILGSPVTFNVPVTMAGTLDAAGNDVRVPSTGHLKITATGKIEANGWGQFIGVTGLLEVPGNADTLLESIRSAAPSYLNNYTTIEVPTDGTLVSFNFLLPLDAISYENLRALAASEVLYLGAGVSLEYNVSEPKTYFTVASADLELKTNDVTLSLFAEIGNVTVDAERSFTIAAGTNTRTAGKIIVYGDFAADNSQFDLKLDELTIGPELFDAALAPVEVTLPVAIFTGASSAALPTAITVNPGAELILGGAGNPVIDPVGSIKLAGQDSVLEIRGTGASLAHLNSLEIEAGAEFTTTIGGTGSNPTFASLEILKVNGLLDVNGGSATFDKLQEDIGNAGDVGGSGRAVFRGMPVTAGLDHAFDQLLGIRDLTVGAVSGIPATAGGGVANTIDSQVPQAGNGPITLTVASITAPPVTRPLDDGYPGRLIINRDLVVLDGGSVYFGAASRTVSIRTGFKVYISEGIDAVTPIKPILSNGGTADSVALMAVGATTLQADYADGSLTAGTANFSVERVSLTPTTWAAGTLAVEGKLTTVSIAQLLAGSGTALINLQTATLEKVNVTTNADNTGKISVTSSGTLRIGAPSVVLAGSSVTVATGGKIVSASTLSFGANEGSFSTDVPAIGIGTLVAGSNDFTITGRTDTTDVTPPLDNYGYATIDGDVIGTLGGSVLVGRGTEGQKLVINGTVTLQNSGTAYDSIALTQVDILNEFEFNVTANTVTLGNATGILVGRGSATTNNLAIKGANSSLAIGNLGAFEALSAATTINQNLNGVTLNGATGLTGGTLTLATGALLSLAGEFVVGDAGVTSATLSVNAGTIALANASAIVKVAADDGAGIKGTLIINPTYTIAGEIASVIDLASYNAIGEESGTPGRNDVWFTSPGGTTTDPDVPAAAGAASTLGISTGAYSITGNAGDPTTLTSTTKLYRYKS